MTVCSHTGISVPECSCRACTEAQIERHMPSLLIEEAVTTPIEAATRGRRFLMRLRQARRLRRVA
jgi:phosphoribosyl 1,2-cyclic phosphodiesterase